MPRNLASYLKNVALLIPFLRQTSPVATPASCSRRIEIICSSVNLDFLFVQLPLRPSDFTQAWISLRGSDQQERKEIALTGFPFG